ncbi:MAG: FG-GAP-like repeat-containing protein, partial [Hydrotalea sp.]|nr:FG-GAP-like repeat-containing protein [Hydrotalea sp.]
MSLPDFLTLIINILRIYLIFNLPGKAIRKFPAFRLIVILLFINPSLTSAQVPIISNFSPLSGKPGDEIVINGSNFSPIVANNIVFLGNTKAVVTAATSSSLTVTVPFGANYGPISVLNTAVSLSGRSGSFFNPVFSPSKVDLTAGDFAARQDLVTGTNPRGSAQGDLDGDGKPEIIVSNNADNSITIYRNVATSGSLNNSSFISSVTLATGNSPRAIVVGDVDNDGKLDIVVVNNGSTSISVYKNLSTVGTIDNSSFASKVDFGTGFSPNTLGLGDLDNDGYLDIVVTNNSSNTFSVFHNLSTPNNISSASFATKVDFNTGTNPLGLTIADIDGDGKLDVTLVNRANNTVSIFKNTSTNGVINETSFADKIDFSTGNQPNAVATCDIDGDGKLDIIVANRTANSISVFHNTSTNGLINSNSLASKVDFTAGSSPLAFAIGDLTGDGKPDIAVANSGSSSVSVFRNKSILGVIDNSSLAGQLDLTVGIQPLSVIMGDFDGDGKLDLSAPSDVGNTLSLIRNNNSNANLASLVTNVGTLSPVFSSNTISYTTSVSNSTSTIVVTPTVSDPNASIQLRINNGTYSTITSGSPSNSLSLNVGENTIDVLVTAQNGSTNKTYSIVVTRLEPPIPTITSFTPLFAKPGDVINISGNNFNPNASGNIVFFDNIRATVISATETSMQVNVPIGATYAPITIINSANNLMGQSKVQFIPTFSPVKSVITTNDFGQKQEFETGAEPNKSVVGDLDGDGKLDVVVLNFASYSVSVFRNTSTAGSLSFAVKQDILIGSDHDPEDLSLSDLDGDGKLDLIVVNNESNTVSVFRNTSTLSNISFSSRQNFITDVEPNSVRVGDIDGDGKLDIVTSNRLPNSVSVLRNTSTVGNISFATKLDFSTGGQPQFIAIGDFNGDSYLDIATANSQTNNVSILRNNSTTGNISFAPKVDFATGNNPIGIAIGDLNEDGNQDLVVANLNQNNFSYLRNTTNSSSISFAAKTDFASNGSPNSISISDLNGDGKPDIITGNNARISIFRNTSVSGTFSVASRVDLNTQAYAISANDLDGDGISDLMGLIYATQGKFFVLPNRYSANLTGIVVSEGTLSPIFNRDTLNYTASVSNNTNAVTVTPTAADPNATIQIRVNNGTYATVLSGTASSSLALSVGSNTVNVLITAQDGTTIKTYTIIITRLPPNSLINVSGALTDFTSCSGSVSSNQSLVVSGSDLTSNITISAPVGFELSTSSSSGFTSQLDLIQTGGAIPETTIYIRLSETASGTPTGNITLTSSGAVTKNVALNGIVNAIPAVPTISNSRPLTFCEGDNTVLSSSSATGNQWLLNGNIINGATNQTLTVTSAGSYSVQVTNANNCSSTSIATTVTVNALPAVPTISNSRPLTFCVGDNTVLSSSSSSGNQWLLNGNEVSGATGQTLTVTTAGSYSVLVTNANNCSSISASTTVTVNALPTVPTISNSRPLTFCEGDNTVLSSSSATGNQWLLNGNIITGATNQTLTVTSAGSYSVQVTNANNCSSTSIATTVTVNALPAVPTISNSRPLTFCVGDNTVLSSSSATGNQWLLNGNIINGATNQTLTVTSAGSYSVQVTNANNCSSTSIATTVTVNALP